ncbi:unnamed protein product [Lepeophtheirus salmonis]|uniref:(salmon louse) hypothetical protein n=1 Tax=Lepeophtheirus salmonis TaxID=72036 RepID=A0A7R8CJW7_LEPSM|nr:unnamed protein product [Lepeophtheirus salmonis]CAF2843425.1 unnamed protein product [Lepeophtheirus salmonis]
MGGKKNKKENRKNHNQQDKLNHSMKPPSFSGHGCTIWSILGSYHSDTYYLLGFLLRSLGRRYWPKNNIKRSCSCHCTITGSSYSQWILFGRMVKLYLYILTVSVPIMLVGGKSTSFIATTAFITDISPPRMAAVRLGILHVTQSISEPLANIVGAFLLDSGGFVVVYLFGFIFSAAAYVSLYVCMMKYKTTITEKRKKSFRELMSPRIFIDCFKTFSKVRAGKLRMILYLSLVNLILILTSIIGEATIAYLYVRTRYKWEVTDFSFYKSIDKVTAIFFQSALIPLLSYVNINNENFLICIIISFCLRHLTMGLAYEPWLYYAGTMLDVIGSYAFSIIRATISDILPKSEMGKVLSMVISLENIMIIISIKIYQTIWSMTDTILPGTVYFVSAFMCSWALVSTLIIKFHLKGKSIGKYFEEVTGKDRDENDLVTSKPKKLKSEEVEANEDGYENNFTRQA